MPLQSHLSQPDDCLMSALWALEHLPLFYCQLYAVSTVKVKKSCSGLHKVIGLLTCSKSRSSATTAALFQSITSLNGSTQSLLRITGIQAACRTSKNLHQSIRAAAAAQTECVSKTGPLLRIQITPAIVIRCQRILLKTGSKKRHTVRPPA